MEVWVVCLLCRCYATVEHLQQAAHMNKVFEFDVQLRKQEDELCTTRDAHVARTIVRASLEDGPPGCFHHNTRRFAPWLDTGVPNYFRKIRNIRYKGHKSAQASEEERHVRSVPARFESLVHSCSTQMQCSAVNAS